ncbi:PI-PLC X-box domain-containing protein DDB_G0293730-like isoform X2 [Rhopalosiphum maidis]|uniref:PI-PLC X-box domain-containing protein DDB_G0293730-like isoform X2 n=1 Tax=Rhopalosiphum maidis TaxID=43146 RepID=UPI000EFDD7EB|nr:PI-PLC X-box domain-containing protein DDB_G0293730-like isoform X2 [Rhopalosiphum maidis]
MSRHLWWILIWPVLQVTKIGGKESPDFEFGHHYVGLTVLPDIEQQGGKRVVVSWQVLSANPNDWVGVFGADPAHGRFRSATEMALRKYPVNATSGWLETDLTVGTKTIQLLCHDGQFKSQCFEYWVAYISGETDTLLATNCLKTQPNWMDNLTDDIKSLRLNSLFLPGTHDSGAYDITQNCPIYFEKYVYTQDVDILSQLCHGARYLDLRVGFDCQSDHLWWLHHEIYPVRPLSYILEDIKTFVEATNEIVIVEFHKFQTGFSKNLSEHLKLYQFVTLYLGKHMAKMDWNKSLKDLQAEGHRVIVTYNYLPITLYANDKNLWTPIPRYWPNAQKLTTFEDYNTKRKRCNIVDG